MRLEDKILDGDVVPLDGNEYVRCTFATCRFTFGATAPFTLDQCRFKDCTWAFVGAAAFTLKFMRVLNQGTFGDEARTFAARALADIAGAPPENRANSDARQVGT
jgi:hypothetical protein